LKTAFISNISGLALFCSNANRLWWKSLMEEGKKKNLRKDSSPLKPSMNKFELQVRMALGSLTFSQYFNLALAIAPCYTDV
jgi:hypothetical protein